MTSRPLVILGVIIIAIAIIAAVGYAVNGRDASSSIATGTASTNIDSNTTDQSNPSSSTAPTGVSPVFYQSTTTPDPLAADNGLSSNANQGIASGAPSGTSSDRQDVNGAILLSGIPFPASTTESTASWTVYSDYTDGYSFEHPADMTQNSASAVFSFPKNSYFHWPLLDDVKVTVTVGTACPQLIGGTGGPNSQGPTPFSLNGYSFTRTIGTDVGAGQRYLEVAYDTQTGGQCYHIDLLDHGTNGAGFYVDDAALVAKYDEQHATDMASALAAFDGIVSSFHLLAPVH